MKTNQIKATGIALIVGLGIAGAQGATNNAPAIESGGTPAKEKVQLKDYTDPARLTVAGGDNAALRQARKNAFGAEEIQLNGVIGQHLMFAADALHLMDWEHTFLDPFISKTSNKKGTYFGLGKNLEALVLMSVYRGQPQDLALKEQIFRRIREAQSPDGYLGVFPENLRGRNIDCDTHESTYVMKALAADGRIAGDPQSSQAASALAKWVVEHWAEKGTSTWGMENCFLEFGANGAYDLRYGRWLLDNLFSNQVYNARRWKPQLGYSAEHDDFDPAAHHVYYDTSISRAQRVLNQIEPHALLTRPGDSAVSWIKDGGGLLPGIFSYWERWTKSQFGRSGVYDPGAEFHLDSRMHKLGEVCEFVHVAELMSEMTKDADKPESFQYDLVERVIYNALFAAQSTEARREWNGTKQRYDVPMEGPRPWFDKQTYCCPNNFRRYLFSIPKYIYTARADGIYVNLYEASHTLLEHSSIRWDFSQETDYPKDGRIVFRINPEKAAKQTIFFRIPAWCDRPELSVNGERVKEVKPGSYAAISRTWKPGDVVEVNLPMEWKWVAGFREQEGRAGLMRGPLVFSLNPVQGRISGYEDLVFQPEEFMDAMKYDVKGRWPAYQTSYDRLRQLVLDPASLKLTKDSSTENPYGIGARVKAWSDSKLLGKAPDLELSLTPFADEGGRATFFKLNTNNGLVEDPLLASELKERKLFPKLWTELGKEVELAKLAKLPWTPSERDLLVPCLRSSYDEMCSAGRIAGHPAWMSVKDAQRTYRKMGFRMSKDYLNRKMPHVQVNLVYIDRGNCTAELLYDSLDENWDVLKSRPDLVPDTRRSTYGRYKGAFKSAGKFNVGDTGEWKVMTFDINDARLHTKSDGKDFLLYLNKDVNFVVQGLYVSVPTTPSMPK